MKLDASECNELGELMGYDSDDLRTTSSTDIALPFAFESSKKGVMELVGKFFSGRRAFKGHLFEAKLTLLAETTKTTGK